MAWSAQDLLREEGEELAAAVLAAADLVAPHVAVQVHQVVLAAPLLQAQATLADTGVHRFAMPTAVSRLVSIANTIVKYSYSQRPVVYRWNLPALSQRSPSFS